MSGATSGEIPFIKPNDSPRLQQRKNIEMRTTAVTSECLETSERRERTGAETRQEDRRKDVRYGWMDDHDKNINT